MYAEIASKEPKVMTRDDLRVIMVETIVKQIYTQVVYSAQQKPDTVYQYQVPEILIGWNPKKTKANPNYIENMEAILAGLQALFPDSAVSHTLLAYGKGGKLYDIAKLDDATLALVDTAMAQSHIVIDWT
jgi:hypothetical protein